MFVSTLGLGQEHEEFGMKMEPEVPNFNYEVNETPLATRDSVTVDIVIQVPFNAIQFVKKDSVFVARYEISVLLVDENEVNAVSKIWTQTLRTKLFSETYSGEHFDINKLTYKLKPSPYSMTIGVLDLDTRKSSFRKKEINLKDFYKKSITIGNINIIEKGIPDSVGKKEDLPTMMGMLSDTGNVFDISFYMLSDGGKGSVKYSIYNLSKKLITENTIEREFEKGVICQKLSIPRNNLTYSKYRLVLTAKIGADVASAEKIIQIRWFGMSNMIDNLDVAIDQLRYIASNSVIKKMNKAKDTEKKKLFQDFWRAKDPTPDTVENELMNEYYRRANYANQNFSGFQEGWRSDMGMVFILFGPPSDIERHPFEIQTKPYEIWYYYEINRSFVFVDETGFGEYRLITPFDYTNSSFY